MPDSGSHLPQLDAETRASALDKAMAIRQARAKVKKDLHDGEITLEEIFDKSDDQVYGGIRVIQLVSQFPGLGKVRSAKLMEELGISGNRRVRGLGVRQRQALIDALEER